MRRSVKRIVEFYSELRQCTTTYGAGRAYFSSADMYFCISLKQYIQEFGLIVSIALSCMCEAAIKLIF